MKIKWLGHASFLITSGGKKVYIDPYAGEYTEKADLILVTHGHRDHCDLHKISQVVKPDTFIVTCLRAAGKVRGVGVEVLPLEPGEEKEVKGFRLLGVEAYNTHRFMFPKIPFHSKGSQVAFIIEAEGKRLYHAGDTDLLPSMKELGPIDVAMIPIGGRYTMDVKEAAEAVKVIRPKVVLPMHRRNADVEEFKKLAEEGSDAKVVVLKEGEELEVP
ncbi:MBL fold metallo-hydrolase [Candidatus Bathyarchaeota archaeon]|nr:MBL fold metallo-hydrolase [Candidatus Bathyarchaeota archaeon]